jgi:hypothetical protein
MTLDVIAYLYLGGFIVATVEPLLGICMILMAAALVNMVKV